MFGSFFILLSAEPLVLWKVFYPYVAGDLQDMYDDTFPKVWDYALWHKTKVFLELSGVPHMHRDDKCKLHALGSVRRYVRRCFQAVRQHSKKFRWVRTMSILKNQRMKLSGIYSISQISLCCKNWRIKWIFHGIKFRWMLLRISEIPVAQPYRWI